MTSSLIDFEALYNQSTSTKPILIMFIEEPESVKRSFVNYVKTKDKQIYNIIEINGLGQAEDKQVKKLLAKQIEEVEKS